MIYTACIPSPVGELTLACEHDRIMGLWLSGQKYFGANLLKAAERMDDLPVFTVARQWLDSYFSGGQPSPFDLPLSPVGSAFRQAVWARLCAIPYGKITTYGEIAQELAEQMEKSHMSAQAVGGAVGHNPISIIIPCHRVVGANNSLTGYAGGLAVKKRLLALEGVDISRLTSPSKGTAL